MSIRKLMLLMGLCVFFAGCSTGRYAGSDMETSTGNSTTDMGVRYLLGHGVQQNNEKAFSYFIQAAKDGDPFAQSEVGYMYAAGKGVERNDEKAFEYYQKAAEHGLSGAQYNLGLMYLHGMGTEKNKELGLQWIKKSAAHGFEPAKQTLAQYKS